MSAIRESKQRTQCLAEVDDSARLGLANVKIPDISTVVPPDRQARSATARFPAA